MKTLHIKGLKRHHFKAAVILALFDSKLSGLMIHKLKLKSTEQVQRNESAELICKTFGKSYRIL